MKTPGCSCWPRLICKSAATVMMIVALTYTGWAITDEDVVLKADSSYWTAHSGKNPEQLRQVLADDATITHSDGRVTKKPDEIRVVSSPNPPELNENSWVEDRQVRLYGDSAVVTVVFRMKVPYKCDSYDWSFSFLNMFHKIDGGWQIVAAHASRRSAGSTPRNPAKE